MSGIELISKERERQITEEGWDAHHDAAHKQGELAWAAACYAKIAAMQAQAAHQYGRPTDKVTFGMREIPNDWKWDDGWWKPKDAIRNLVRAGALIAAEIDRVLVRQEPSS